MRSRAPWNSEVIVKLPDSIASLPLRGPIPRDVVDGLPMPVLLSRLSDDTVIAVNPEFTVAYGHADENVRNRPSRDLHFEEEDRARTLTACIAGDLRSVEVRIRTATGACKWAQADVARFTLDGQGDVLLTTFYDIGALKEAEALANDMARFPDMNPGPVVRMRLDGTVLRSNPAARDLFGSDLEGRCFWNVCAAISDPVRQRALSAGEPVREDVRVGDRWFRLTFVHEAETQQLFVFGTEVTSQKSAERELAERARFPAMNPGPVARVSSEGRVIRANPAAHRLFGQETLDGQSWLELCPGMDAVLWERVRTSDGPVQHEAEIDGEYVSFTLRHEPIADQVFVYGSDVTALKQAERELSELSRFPSMNPGPVCRLDRAGRVLLANPAAQSVFGSEDLIGRSWPDLVPEVSRAFWDSVLEVQEPRSLEAKIGDRHFVLTHAPGPDGVFVFVYGSDVTREKEAERVLRQSEKMATLGTLAAGVAHELNNPAGAAQRAADQLSVSFAALEKAYFHMAETGVIGDLGELLSELEVRARDAAACPCDLDALDRSEIEAEIENWLEERGVQEIWEIAPSLVEGGYRLEDLHALAERAGREHVGLVATWYAHSHRVHRLLEEIREGTGRLAEIVGAMKAYSYLGQAPVQSVDVNEGLRNTLVILRGKLKDGIRVEQELSPDLPRIEGFGGELNQVWTNLLDNAADAMNGKGTIRLKTALADGRVVVEVEDDGPGVPLEAQSRVFDAFFTTKAPGKGTGLGLNTSYRIVVDKHGGAISVSSRPGCTRFTVELPLRRTEEPNPPVPDPMTPTIEA